MKSINPPFVDNELELDLLANSKNLGSYPDLLITRQEILSQYQLYTLHNGNPWSITTLNLSKELQAALITHYGHPPLNQLPFLAIFRNDLSPHICPMCGSHGTGTLDHYLPKDDFAEFAIFSLNLIPACKCNEKRRKNVKGNDGVQRVIHPYFDHFVAAQVYKFDFSGDFYYPTIRLLLNDPAHPQATILNFHLDSVVLKNNVIGWANKIWSELVASPRRKLMLNEGDYSMNAVRGKLTNFRDIYQTQTDSPNNWSSLFYNGILEDAALLHALVLRTENSAD